MNLKEKFGSRYRVTLDESFKIADTESRKEEWRYQEIKGKYGVIFPYGWDKPAVTFTSNVVANRFSQKANDWQILQNGEDERTYLIPKSDLGEIFDAIKPRKKRQLTPEQRERLIEMGKKHSPFVKSNVSKPS